MATLDSIKRKFAATIQTMWAVVLAWVNWAEQEMRVNLPPSVQAIVNCGRARAMRNPRAIVDTLRARGCSFVVINNDDYHHYPALLLAPYRAILEDGLPCFIRAKAADGRAMLGYLDMTFEMGGDMAIIGREGIAPACLPTAQIVKALRDDGCWLLTVDDAVRILEGRIAANVDQLMLRSKKRWRMFGRRHRWLTPVEDIADHAGISSRLFAICRRTVRTGMPCILAYRPVGPSWFRLRRFSLRKIVVPAPTFD